MLKVLTFLSVFLFFMCTPLWGQITITENTFLPENGAILKSHDDSSMDEAFFNTMTAGSGGGMLWNFSGRAYDTGTVAYVIEPSSTPDIASFPTANLVIMDYIEADTTWAIFRSVPELFTSLGIVIHSPDGDQLLAYHDASPDWIFPLSYGNEWTSFRHWSVTLEGYRVDYYDTTYNEADAWGTMTYNAKSLPCLRIMSHEHSVGMYYDESDVFLYTLVTDIYTANFIGENFNTAASLSKIVTTFQTIYTGSASAEFLGTVTEVHEVNPDLLPTSFSLEQNYPNPFNPTTEIRLNLKSSSDIRLVVYDILGREVKVLIDQPLDAGSYIVDWDGTNRDGEQAASGIYFYRLIADQFTETRKMVLVR